MEPLTRNTHDIVPPKEFVVKRGKIRPPAQWAPETAVHFDPVLTNRNRADETGKFGTDQMWHG